MGNKALNLCRQKICTPFALASTCNFLSMFHFPVLSIEKLNTDSIWICYVRLLYNNGEHGKKSSIQSVQKRQCRKMHSVHSNSSVCCAVMEIPVMLSYHNLPWPYFNCLYHQCAVEFSCHYKLCNWATRCHKHNNLLAIVISNKHNKGERLLMFHVHPIKHSITDYAFRCSVYAIATLSPDCAIQRKQQIYIHFAYLQVFS